MTKIKNGVTNDTSSPSSYFKVGPRMSTSLHLNPNLGPHRLGSKSVHTFPRSHPARQRPPWGFVRDSVLNTLSPNNPSLGSFVVSVRPTTHRFPSSGSCPLWSRSALRSIPSLPPVHVLTVVPLRSPSRLRLLSTSEITGTGPSATHHRHGGSLTLLRSQKPVKVEGDTGPFS